MKVLQSLGKRIKRLREERGLTQEAFEGVSGINARYLSALERGTKNATVDVLYRIAKGLNIQMFSLFLFDAEADSSELSTQAFKKYLDSLPKEQLEKFLRIVAVISN